MLFKAGTLPYGVAATQSPVTASHRQSRLVAPGHGLLGKKDCLFFWRLTRDAAVWGQNSLQFSSTYVNLSQAMSTYVNQFAPLLFFRTVREGWA